jgi:4-amino-4-deoxy-L-arabinose transferase-like glycosyltransferase
VGLAVVILVAVLLYSARLDWQYLSIEEVSQSLQALELSRSGRSVDGQRWPLYFSEPHYPAGRDPVWIYLSAATISLVGAGDGSLRVPSVLAAVIGVGLMWFVARRLTGSASAAFVAALLLALAPSHFIQGRLATSTIGPVPFVLLWLLFLSRYLDEERPSDLGIAVASLGVGVYTYLGAAVIMPGLLVVTAAAVLRRVDDRSSQTAAARAALAALALTLLPWVTWHTVHTERFASLADYYTRNGYNRDLGLSAFVGIESLIARLDTWWNAFNPDRMFFSGDSNLRFSTRFGGHLLLPLAPFVILGVVQLLRGASTRTLDAVLLAVLLLTPLPAVLVMDFEIKRWLAAVPVLILIAVRGLDYVWRSQFRYARAVVIGALCASALQFTLFAADYWGGYRGRASFYFGGNLRAAIAEVLDQPRRPDCVLLDERNLYAEMNWRWYATARGVVDSVRVWPVTGLERALVACQRVSIIALDQSIDEAMLDTQVQGRAVRRVHVPDPGGLTFLTVYHLAEPGQALR